MIRAATWSLAGVVLLAGCASSCSRRESVSDRPAGGSAAPEPVVVAVAWPWEAREQIRFAQGLALATDEVNSEGGVLGRRLEIVRFDDKESVDEGRRVAQQIASDGRITAVIGHLQSYVSVPAASIYARAGLVMVAPTSTDPELTSRGYERVFRIPPTDTATGRQMADFAADRGYQSVAIYYVRNDYGRGLANAFEARAGERRLTVAARQSYDPDADTSDTVFEDATRKWAQVELGAIFVAGEVPTAARLVAVARANGIAVPILGGDAMGGPSLITQAGAAAEGTMVASFFHPDEPEPEVQRFVQAYSARFGAVPDVGAAAAFDAVRLLAHGMRQAGSTSPETVARALHGLKGWSGATGHFSFDAAGDRVDQRLLVVVVRGGRFERLDERRPAQTSTGATS